MTTISGRISGIFSGKTAQATVKAALESLGASQRGAARDLFVTAASADRNRHLSDAEATQAAGLLTLHGGDVAQARAALEATLAQAAAGKNLDGIRSYFSSTTKDLADVVITGMRDVVDAAAGRPVELNAMIFAFTEQKIADEIISLLQEHPNVTVNLIADFSAHASSGGRQPSKLEARAKQLGLGDRLGIKFKKDNPYTWDSARQRPIYNHALSKGLNHHKGLVALIDGKPAKLITGSYNWSKTAGAVNYESLFVIDANNAANRQLIGDYQAEFAAFFNHADSLGVDGIRAYKQQLINALRVAHGLAAEPVAPATPGPSYAPPDAAASFDLNHLSDANYAALKALVGDSRIVSSISYQLATYGPFSDFANLIDRVPRVGQLSAKKRADLEANLEFGEGSVPLATASADELVRSLKISKTAALSIVAKRSQLGDFESVEQLRGLPGISDSVLERIRSRLNDDVGRAFFSAKAISDSAPKTGYAAKNAAKVVPVLGTNGAITSQPANLAAGVVDLVRRAKPGDTMRIAQYGFSLNAYEYSDIVDAAARGVAFQIVLDDGYNGAVAQALKAQAAAGLPIEVRMQKRTMHQKFGVVNDDAFFGSSNFSTSSSDKNSEDRFVVKNNPELAAELNAEFAALWLKSTPA
jgi:phosphatidylserine/phosphatidylglycerophosphate/cardiolipin synthase-like enzyme